MKNFLEELADNIRQICWPVAITWMVVPVVGVLFWWWVFKMVRG